MKAQWRDWPLMMKAPLKPCYWLSSDDPLLTEEALLNLRAAAKSQGFEREVFHLSTLADWEQFQSARQNFSLFSPKPFYECHLSEAKFKDGVQAQIQSCAQVSPGSACIAFVTPKIEAATQKTKWFEASLTNIVWLPLWPLEGDALSQYSLSLARNAGLQFTQDAAMLFTTQCTDLLSAKQTLMRLMSLPSQVIDITTLQDYLPETLPGEVFSLSDVALKGDAVQTAKQFFALNAQENYQVLMLWSLTRDLDTLMALKANQSPFILPKRKALFMKALNRFSQETLQRLWKRCADLDRALKGGKEGFLAADQLLGLYIDFSLTTITSWTRC